MALVWKFQAALQFIKGEKWFSKALNTARKILNSNKICMSQCEGIQVWIMQFHISFKSLSSTFSILPAPEENYSLIRYSGLDSLHNAKGLKRPNWKMFLSSAIYSYSQKCHTLFHLLLWLLISGCVGYRWKVWVLWRHKAHPSWFVVKFSSLDTAGLLYFLFWFILFLVYFYAKTAQYVGRTEENHV